MEAGPLLLMLFLLWLWSRYDLGAERRKDQEVRGAIRLRGSDPVAYFKKHLHGRPSLHKDVRKHLRQVFDFWQATEAREFLHGQKRDRAGRTWVEVRQPPHNLTTEDLGPLEELHFNIPDLALQQVLQASARSNALYIHAARDQKRTWLALAASSMVRSGNRGLLGGTDLAELIVQAADLSKLPEFTEVLSYYNVLVIDEPPIPLIPLVQDYLADTLERPEFHKCYPFLIVLSSQPACRLGLASEVLRTTLESHTISI